MAPFRTTKLEVRLQYMNFGLVHENYPSIIALYDSQDLNKNFTDSFSFQLSLKFYDT